MYLNDICVRNEFYESIGMNTRKYVDEVLRETNRDAAKAFPVIIDMENPKFWGCLKKCEENNDKLVAIDESKSPEWLKKIQKLPYLVNNGVQFLTMYLQPSIPAPKNVVL
jgi:magnesium-protoporphyrin IX monomethyl ester (oxidative) cyclase